MSISLRGTGLRRYTRKHLRHDRDAARAECKRLKERLKRSAQANRDMAERKDQALAENRDLKQQAEVTDALVTKVHIQIRELKAKVSELSSDRPKRPAPSWVTDSETTQNIPVDQLPQMEATS